MGNFSDPQRKSLLSFGHFTPGESLFGARLSVGSGQIAIQFKEWH
jgi:hypothetical protein